MLQEEHEVQSLDVAIANAAYAGVTDKLIDTPIPELQKYIDINVYGPFEVWKATLPLMKAGKAGRFCFVSSAAGSIASMYNIIPVAPYGASKALGNFLLKWLSPEQKDLLVWCQHPEYASTMHLLSKRLLML